MLPSDSFMSNLLSQLGYSTREFQAWQLIVFAVLGAVNQPLAFCMFVHFLKPSFKRQLVCKFDITEYYFFS